MCISELEIALLLQIPAVLAEQMARLAKEELPKAPFVSCFYFPCLKGLIKMLGGLSAVAQCSNVFSSL